MRVLGPLLWLHDRVDNDLAETPAFRDADGDCVMPGNLRLFLVKLAAETGIDVDSRGIGLHSLRIARTGAWAAAMEDSSEDGFFSSARREADRQITGFTLDQLTGHSSSSGTAAYIRSEIALSLAADRAAATAVMAPIEILYQFNSDRSQSQQITVRLDSATGEYSTVDDTTILHNYGGVDSDDDDDEDVDDSSTVNDSDDGDQAGSVSSDSCTDSQRVMSVDSDGPFSDAESDTEQQERDRKTLQEYRHSQASDADDDPDDSGDDPPSDNEKANGRPRRVKLMPQTARSGRGTPPQQTARRTAAAAA